MHVQCAKGGVKVPWQHLPPPAIAFGTVAFMVHVGILRAGAGQAAGLLTAVNTHEFASNQTCLKFLLIYHFEEFFFFSRLEKTNMKINP